MIPVNLEPGWHLLKSPTEPEQPYLLRDGLFHVKGNTISPEDLGKIPGWSHQGQLFTSSEVDYRLTEAMIGAVGSVAAIRANRSVGTFAEGVAWAKSRALVQLTRLVHDIT